MVLLSVRRTGNLHSTVLRGDQYDERADVYGCVVVGCSSLRACIVNPLWPCVACAADIKPSPRYGIVLWEIYMQALPYSGMDAHAVIAQGAGEQQVLAGNEALTAFQWRINTDDPHCRPQHVGSTST